MLYVCIYIYVTHQYSCATYICAHAGIDETVTSGAYRVVTDEQHNTMNYFKVIKPPTKYEELRIKVTEPQIYIIEKPVPVKVWTCTSCRPCIYRIQRTDVHVHLR